MPLRMLGLGGGRPRDGPLPLEDVPELAPEIPPPLQPHHWWKSPWVYRPAVLIGIIVVIVFPILAAKHILRPLKPPVHDVMRGSGAVGLDFNNGTSYITFFYQNGTGDIEEWFFDETTWSRRQPVQISSEYSPRTGTPLMAAWYSLDESQQFFWHIFYIDRNDTLRDVKRSNITNKWIPGSLGSHNFKASSSSTTGLTACVSSWYGSPVGMRLYYGSVSTNAIQELKWSPEGDAWSMGNTFVGSDPDGGCECTRRGSSITNLWHLNRDGTLMHSWYDFNTSANSSTHTAGTWVSANVSYTSLRKHSSLSAIGFNDTRNIVAQHENNTLVELIMTGNAENATLSNAYLVSDTIFMNGTKTGCVVLNSTTLMGSDFHLWAQPEDSKGCSGIDEYVRPLSSIYWSRDSFHANGCKS